MRTPSLPEEGVRDGSGMVCIIPLEHRDQAMAGEIHELQTLAYQQEARLLNVSVFPPLERKVEDVMASDEYFLGAIQEETLVGVLSFGRDEEPGQVLITSLVVHPHHQRMGNARALIEELLRMGPNEVFSVCTARANTPALALYRGVGFIEYRFGTIGPEALPLVKLRRPSSNPFVARTG